MKNPFRQAARTPPWNNEESIRAELFGAERLEEHAVSLAAAQTLAARTQRERSLNARLRENGSVLLASYRAIAAAVDGGRAITPAAEWLLDNYHLVEEQIREIHDDLPRGFYRQLPKLASGPFAGYPRVFGLAWAYIAHTDSAFDPELLHRFVRAYQRVEPLTIGELWAVAITLRIVLVENLRRSARRIVTSRIARDAADGLADRLLGKNGDAPQPVAAIAGHYAGLPLAGAFALQLVQRLRDHDPKVTPALAWLEECLAAQGRSGDAIVHEEHQRQGATNVTVRNIITSMRLISEVDWPAFVEGVSLVDGVLRAGSEFGAMDFATRNLYRSAIEELARGSAHPELAIAHRALAAHAEQASCDPGHHLIAGGRRAFERSLGYRAPLANWPGRFTARMGVGGYITAVVLLALLALALPLAALGRVGVAGWWLALLVPLALVPAIDAAMAIVNRAVTRGFNATILPGLALRDGVPASLRTLVAVPILITTAAAIEDQIDRLEVLHLASPGGELHFALISDWSDACAESRPDDAPLLAAALAGIARLNRQYGPAAGGARFALLHRRRLWNPGESRWIGWERKRGKLHELNRLLRGARDTTFVAASTPAPENVRFVITLDADTRLPRETARRLIGKLAHPLNRPRFDTTTQRIIAGYGVLQPRVTAALPMAREGSLYQRIFASASGIDPYAAAASDVYQDLFGEGSYTGKGIYDIDAFEAALAGRVPESTLLSHDLFEGTFARAGLASDVEVLEESPSRYDEAAARQHRWARGDWQLLPWLLGRGHALPATAPASARRLPLIGRWKMFDNLRRTLSAPACVLALVAGWTLPLAAALAWTGFIVATIVLATLLPLASAVVPRHAGITLRSHLRALATDSGLAAAQCVLLIVFLADQARVMTDAIVRTLYRLLVSRAHLLDWVTAAQSRISPRLDLRGFYRQMSPSVAIAVIAAAIVAWAGTDAWPVAAPFVLAWGAAPAIARWASLAPPASTTRPTDAADTRALRLVARRTWRYFETFVTAADNMLPPDNFQVDPDPVVAHRTSPTNIGLYLLAAVAARDFGWSGTTDTVRRLAATLATLGGLARHRGHFLNWYDTRDLRPLEPQYVSSVDSGNLAGHLIALANAFEGWLAPTARDAVTALAGLGDNLRLTREALRALSDDRRVQTVAGGQLDEALDALEAAIAAATATAGGTSAPKTPVAIPDPIGDAAATLADIARTLANERGDAAGAELQHWAQTVLDCWQSHQRDVRASAAEQTALAAQLAEMAASARGLAAAMDFGFLLDRHRQLLAIGYRVADGELDPSCYDLLASEARLASFFAIAKGDVPSRHWFRLGRAVTACGRGAALISWSGSMFEYLMPSLVMRAPAHSLIEQSARLVVARQIAYAARLGIPWGISESAYNVRDLEFTYQYSNFGVPGLGLKRGLSENVVIAPYATALAAMVDPRAAARNFARLAALGASGRYGFFEALDYTRSRLPEGEPFVPVRTFMAHHQGMTIVAIANALTDGAMRARFHAEPIVRATELLLQERTPRDVAVAHPRAEEVGKAPAIRNLALPAVRRFDSPHLATPQVHLLSNGRYVVMLTAAGSGYSRWGEAAITRWREDATRDDWGSYVFLRAVDTGAVWSAGYQPSGVEPASYVATFTEDRGEIVRSDGAFTTTLDVVVSPEDDAEVRRVTIVNTGTRAREIDVTSYAELVLAPVAADAAHPAFSKLFVQTEFLPRIGAILATRRRRAPDEPEIWAAHLAVVEGETLGPLQYETDRARFLGRGNETRTPVAVMDGRPLSDTAGTVLDPVFALRRRLQVPPGKSVRVAFWTVVADTRAGVLDLLDKHHDAAAFERAATLAWTHAQVQLSYLAINAEDAGLYQRLAGHVLYADPSMRPGSEAIRRGSGGPDGLWSQGISGDRPLVVVRIDELDDLAIVQDLLHAHEYWRMKQLAVDLVILNERGSSYVQDLQIALEKLVRTSQSRPLVGAGPTRGAVFVVRADLLPAHTRALLVAVARVVLAARQGTLAEQLGRLTVPAPEHAPPARRATRPTAPASTASPPALEYFNGLGGFGAGGREYVTVLGPGRATPAPWVNIIANAEFGTQIAAEGSGFSWAASSRENQLTPWSNDPVADRPGEVLYVRDEDSGELWGPTAAPIGSTTAPFVAIHGQGYSRFEHQAHGIALELVQFVPLADPIKIARLVIRNKSGRHRRLSITAYVEWVLGRSRESGVLSTTTGIDPASGALFARNPWNRTFGTQVAFIDLGGRQTAWTGDRREFLGRNGTLDNPAALARDRTLSGRIGSGLDACGVLQATLELKPGQSSDIVFVLGQCASAEAARALIDRYRRADLDAVLRAVAEYWDDVLGTVQVSTPDRAMDIMLNRWLLYQTIACRIWARSGFYQASGAYGFRDQLQDGMALAIAQPQMTRAHLLRAAGRQFAAGDVQHWWLPPRGEGVRTRIADDRIWLAYATAHYVDTTADAAVLNEPVAFLDGQRLQPAEQDAFFEPSIGEESGTLFEHCARGLDASLALGAHGLPLIGAGDWNDGMNRVGAAGRGESVWLGWFLHATLAAFVPIAQARGEIARAAHWRAHMAALGEAIERDGWDGDWYRRGFFDDGTPLGSAASSECRIDSIAQSWSVLAGTGDPQRARRAMAALEQHLTRADDGLELLFTPPYDRGASDPGYVKGYPPGVRENGGQYTHAAAWSVIAYARLGDGDRAAQMFTRLNPIGHADTRAGIGRYKVEPYVVAADIYSEAPLVGRGGWTWYTGSAAWLYRAGLESILGFRVQGASLILTPCVPTEWPGYEIVFKYRRSRYVITIENPDRVGNGVARLALDGRSLAIDPARVPLIDDGAVHVVRLILGRG